MTLRGFFLLQQAYLAEQKHQQQLDDIRAFRLIDVVTQIAGGKTRLKPGDLFPSLQEIETTDMEEDPETTLQNAKALFDHLSSLGR